MSFERRELGNPQSRIVEPLRKSGPITVSSADGRTDDDRICNLAVNIIGTTYASHQSALLEADAYLTQPSKLRMLWVYRCLDLPDQSTWRPGGKPPTSVFLWFRKGVVRNVYVRGQR